MAWTWFDDLGGLTHIEGNLYRLAGSDAIDEVFGQAAY